MAEAQLVEKVLTARGVIEKCKKLEEFWQPRNKKMEAWYDILLMNDEFKEEGMESFVSNDPRTFYNMAMHLLCDKIPHRIPIETVAQTEISAASLVESVVARAWQDIDRSYRERGKQNFLRNFVGLELATGWYAVFTYVSKDGFVADVWNAGEVYPEWDETGLVSVARIYTMKKEAAMRFVQGDTPVKYPKAVNSDLVMYNYWTKDATGKIFNAIVLGEDFIKPMTPEKFKRIPIFTGPVGGLPDTGVIKKDDSWKEHYGESVFATNELVYKSYNKQWTFSSQLLRDTAQPRWFERSATGDILRPADMFKRGAIFKGGLQDSIEPLAVPAMPIELRTDRYDMQGMMQRGGLPWSMSGDIRGDMSGYLMAQVASSAMETLGPYHDAIKNCLADIDNFWLSEMMNSSINPYKVEDFVVMPHFNMTAEYTMKIPGDLVQRATVAKMVNPEFTLSTSLVMDILFPEIKNPIKEQALARKDRAMNSPMSIQISTIAAYREAALELRAGGDTLQADLFDKAAQYLEDQLFAPQGQEAGAQPPLGAEEQLANYGKMNKPRQEAMPRQAMNSTPVGQ
jgi:hypothetical protein